jgi:hypothetical protein
MNREKNQVSRPPFILRAIRQPIRLALVVGFCYLVVGFINIEIWLVNQSPFINGGDLLACILAVVAVRVLVRIIPDTKKVK